MQSPVQWTLPLVKHLRSFYVTYLLKQEGKYVLQSGVVSPFIQSTISAVHSVHNYILRELLSLTGTDIHSLFAQIVCWQIWTSLEIEHGYLCGTLIFAVLWHAIAISVVWQSAVTMYLCLISRLNRGSRRKNCPSNSLVVEPEDSVPEPAVGHDPDKIASLPSYQHYFPKIKHYIIVSPSWCSKFTHKNLYESFSRRLQLPSSPPQASSRFPYRNSTSLRRTSLCTILSWHNLLVLFSWAFGFQTHCHLCSLPKSRFKPVVCS